jgi:hypothetical protein
VPKVAIAPLVNAIDHLQEGLARYHSEPADDQLRGGLIQRFELDLPFKVDVIDLRSVDPAFRALIEPDMIALAF